MTLTENEETSVVEDPPLLLNCLENLLQLPQLGSIHIAEADRKQTETRSQRTHYGLIVGIEGSWIFKTLIRGDVADLSIEPAQSIVLQPGAWAIEHSGSLRSKLGISVGRNFVYAQQTWHLAGVRRAHKVAYVRSQASVPVILPRLFEAMGALEHDRQPQASARLITRVILIELHKHLKATVGVESGRSKSYTTYRAVLDFIHQNYAMPITRDQVARNFKLHPNHISRLFAQHHQEDSFHQYLNRLRMERAGRLIRRRALSLDECADACGFGDPVHFRKAFKKFHGITPGQFR